MFNHDFKTSCHIQENNQVSESCWTQANFHDLLVLEAWFSIKDPQSGNDHMCIAIWEVYKSLVRTYVLRYVLKKLHVEFSSAHTQQLFFESVMY